MRTGLSVGSRIFLLILAVVTFFSVSQGDSFVPAIRLPCCRNVSTRKIFKIKECFEQKPRQGCNVHAFLITGKRGNQCVDPASKWLIDKIEKGELVCPPDVSLLNFLDKYKL